MSIEEPIATQAEGEAQILRYWRAVELFSPQKAPRLNPNNRTQPVLRSLGETPLPGIRRIGSAHQNRAENGASRRIAVFTS
jgi:hypothetical protein